MRKTRKPRKPRDKYMFRVGRIKLDPGDVVVLQTEQILDKDQVAAVRERAKLYFPNNEVVVLIAGLTVRVITGPQLAEKLKQAA